jgi:hypothetical protein
MGWPGDIKRQELAHKLASIDQELGHWRSESERGRALRKHHSQIEAVTADLEGLAAAIREQLDASGDDEVFLRTWPWMQSAILDVHRIWEFYRAKLALRYVEWFRDPLAAADELAWACYKPAQDQAAPDHIATLRIKEPPLVFFNGGWSPFASARGRGYAAETVPGQTLSQRAMAELLKGLPIPVVGMPWYQMAHLPEAVVIGHEIGHIVEDDFALSATVHALVQKALDDGASAEHRAAWDAWAGEVFGDIYGVLAAGPAFVGALMDFLATDRQTIACEHQEHPHWNPHPPTGLRAEINLAALRVVGLTAEAQALEALWLDRFDDHAMRGFSGDVAAVVAGLVEGPYPEFRGRPLTAVLMFTSEDVREAEAVSKNVLRREVPGARDIRHLVVGLDWPSPTTRRATEDEDTTPATRTTGSSDGSGIPRATTSAGRYAN